MDNDNTPKNSPDGQNSAGLVDIAKRAANPASGEPRKRGRPPGSAAAGPVPGAPVPPAVPVPLWNQGNVGALVRLPPSTAAWITDIKELELTDAEQAMIVPAAVDVLNQFLPMAATYGSIITLATAIISVGASKVKIYQVKTAEREAAEKKAAAKREGNA